MIPVFTRFSSTVRNQLSNTILNLLIVFIILGSILGLVRDYQRLIRYFKLARRHGHINPFVSIYPHFLTRSVYISCDGGRLCR